MLRIVGAVSDREKKDSFLYLGAEPFFRRRRASRARARRARALNLWLTTGGAVVEAMPFSSTTTACGLSLDRPPFSSQSKYSVFFRKFLFTVIFSERAATTPSGPRHKKGPGCLCRARPHLCRTNTAHRQVPLEGGKKEPNGTNPWVFFRSLFFVFLSHTCTTTKKKKRKKKKKARRRKKQTMATTKKPRSQKDA